MSKNFQSRWQLKDYVFAAFMTIGMVLAAFIIGPFVPPATQLLAWAPIAGIFLTLGMARLQRPGSVALMLVPLAVLLGLITPAITAYIAITVLLTELIMWWRGGYRKKINRLLGNVLFFALAAVIGIIVGTLTFGEQFAELLDRPLLIAGITVLCGVAGAVGWWLGELVIKQLKKAGKLDAEL
jgi:energy-coupling factor transport system substrate-specific component